MKGYNARLAQTPNIKFSWIEELDKEVSESEQQWYESVVNNNLVIE